MRLGLVFVLRDGLRSEARARIVSLILIKALEGVIRTTRLGQSPARLILFG